MCESNRSAWTRTADADDGAAKSSNPLTTAALFGAAGSFPTACTIVVNASRAAFATPGLADAASFPSSGIVEGGAPPALRQAANRVSGFALWRSGRKSAMIVLLTDASRRVRDGSTYGLLRRRS